MATTRPFLATAGAAALVGAVFVAVGGPIAWRDAWIESVGDWKDIADETTALGALFLLIGLGGLLSSLRGRNRRLGWIAVGSIAVGFLLVLTGLALYRDGRVTRSGALLLAASPVVGLVSWGHSRESPVVVKSQRSSSSRSTAPHGLGSA